MRQKITVLRGLVLSLVLGGVLVSDNCIEAAGNPGDKLERGVANTFTGWIEIPKGVDEASEVSNPFTALTWGLVRGIGEAITRTSTGVYDTSTFLIPEYDQPLLDQKYAF